ncbi:MAG: formylmethanofuran dehydrogenase [Methanosarcinales archaeon]|nr:formylmethanofuran dehydrogenase [Methanosarcinales archaeon]
MAGDEMRIVTFRDIFQSEAQEMGRYSQEYQDLSAVVRLDQLDMKRLGLKDGQRVAVEGDSGTVVVTARTSDESPHPGVALMPNSPWSNRLVPEETDESRIPEFKNLKGRIVATEEKVKPISELLEELKG